MDFMAEAIATVEHRTMLAIHNPNQQLLGLLGRHEAVARHPAGPAWTPHGDWVLINLQDANPLVHSYDSPAHLIHATMSLFSAPLRALVDAHRYWRLFPTGSSMEWPAHPVSAYRAPRRWLRESA